MGPIELVLGRAELSASRGIALRYPEADETDAPIAWLGVSCRWQGERVISAQFARPRGLLGRLIGRTMARRNAHLTRRVVAALQLHGDETMVQTMMQAAPL